jgi:hypothetical protein
MSANQIRFKSINMVDAPVREPQWRGRPLPQKRMCGRAETNRKFATPSAGTQKPERLSTRVPNQGAISKTRSNRKPPPGCGPMNEKQRDPGNFADSDTPSNSRTRPISLRDRWEELRYGPMGRVLGYVLVFTLVFIAIFLFLLFLERGHF